MGVGDSYHVQTVGVKNRLARAGSKVYGKWHEEVRRRYAEQQPEFGAIWLTYYPTSWWSGIPTCWWSAW
ncbi:Uncharacterised protein [Chromobacterium violaceum]|uniref:Uncharacterized protein n=1 Tax=Chromobacterium violaceum TaxID=536 RepID=A0A3S4LGG8_CHRVL|nr:Uncharacterised protein [Chromobacterium violaceum]